MNANPGAIKRNEMFDYIQRVNQGYDNFSKELCGCCLSQFKGWILLAGFFLVLFIIVWIIGRFKHE